MKNIHLIPTDKEQHSIIQKHTGLLLKQTKQKHFSGNKFNLFITSDEEIKEGDWVLGNFPDKPICKVISKYGEEFTAQSLNGNKHGLSQYDSKKIILTTDQDLIDLGVQSIDDEFIQWYIKNPSCEEVEVEQEILKLVHNPNYVNHTPEGDGIYLTPKSENLQYGETLIEDNVLDYKIIIPVQG